MTDPNYAPSQFYSDIDVPDVATLVNEPLPRAWSEGGIIEAAKRAIVAGLREQFNGSSVNGPDQEYYIDIEYPTKPTQYPGIWVQFAIDSIKNAGLGMSTWTKDIDGNWGEINERQFTGRLTLTIAAETSKDRDRLADAVVSQLSFARSVDLSLRDSRKDAQQMRGLLAAIANNPYVFMTVNTDVVMPGGQTVTSGTPWAPNMLLYEDNYSMNVQGFFNIRFAYDGVFTLDRIDVVPTLEATHSPYNPGQWAGA